MKYQHRNLDGTLINLPLGKVVCVGRNYAEHARELNNTVPQEPLLFIKTSSCVASLLPSFSIPKQWGAVHYEAEIALLLGSSLSGEISVIEARKAIIGLAPALDLTLRDVQSTLKAKGHPWEKAKSFDGACVLPAFALIDTALDLNALEIRFSLNKQLRQSECSSAMLTLIVPLLQYMAGYFSLQAGDVILTGTPAGVGALASGDRVDLELVGVSQFSSLVI